uniref:Uncharacterized protein n=1 Tax=Meloidogyne hapla TaxID=6305 RepID=A0A1I8C0U7_MELHA
MNILRCSSFMQKILAMHGICVYANLRDDNNADFNELKKRVDDGLNEIIVKSELVGHGIMVKVLDEDGNIKEEKWLGHGKETFIEKGKLKTIVANPLNERSVLIVNEESVKNIYSTFKVNKKLKKGNEEENEGEKLKEVDQIENVQDESNNLIPDLNKKPLEAFSDDELNL